MKVYKEVQQLSQYDRMRGDFKVLWPVVKEAFSKRLWLYHKENRQWFTPEEFLEMYQKKQMNNYEVATLNKNLVLRDPREGLSQRNRAPYSAVSAGDRRAAFERGTFLA